MSLHLGWSDQYDLKSLIPIKKVPLYMRVFLFMSIVYYLPKILYGIAIRKVDHNPFHDGQRHLSGKKIIATSNDIMF